MIAQATVGMVAGAGALLVSSLAACAGDATTGQTHSPSSSSDVAISAEPAAGGRADDDARARVLDPLTFTLVLGTPQGDRLPARLRVENRSGDTVTDSGCRLGANYSFGVVPATDPGARLAGGVMTRCAGVRDLPDGFSEAEGGPTFSLRGLPPGRYLATIDFGNARSERLTAGFSIEAP